MRNPAGVLVSGAIMMLAGCGREAGPPGPGKPAQVGVASWYGVPFHGRKTANGEIFNMNQLTAAHRTLPFGARVRTRNLSNNETVEVRINDRGPFVADRIIDLSRAAAQNIGITGTGKVRLEILSLPVSRELPVFGVQVAMLADAQEAARLRDRLQQQYGAAIVLLRDDVPPMWRVVVGREATEEGANVLASRLAPEFGAVFAVRTDEEQRVNP